MVFREGSEQFKTITLENLQTENQRLVKLIEDLDKVRGKLGLGLKREKVDKRKKKANEDQYKKLVIELKNLMVSMRQMKKQMSPDDQNNSVKLFDDLRELEKKLESEIADDENSYGHLLTSGPSLRSRDPEPRTYRIYPTKKETGN